jgi:hypothetical protein
MSKLNLGKDGIPAYSEEKATPETNETQLSESGPETSEAEISTDNTMAALAAAAKSADAASQLANPMESAGEKSEPDFTAATPVETIHGVDAVAGDVVRCFKMTFTIFEGMTEIPGTVNPKSDKETPHRLTPVAMRNNTTGQFVNFAADLSMELIVPSIKRTPAVIGMTSED